MPKLRIDGREVRVDEGATLLDAARAAGIHIHTLCHHPGLDASTSCMICLVKVNGGRTLLPSCATPAAEGMEVESETEEVRAARRMNLELLASDHTGDCVAPCQRADDRHADIPRFLRQVQAGDLDGAAATLEAAGISLDDPEAIDVSRAEKACRRGRWDETVAIAELARYVAAHRRAGGGSAAADPPPYREFGVRIAKLTPEEMAELLALATPGPQITPTSPAAGYNEAEAREEASRCQHCDCRQSSSCRLRNACEAYGVQIGRFRSLRPPLELERSHPDILHEPGKCILCGLCLQVAERAGEELGIAFVGRGFDMRVKVPFDSPLAEALRRSATACADVCPTGSLVRRQSPSNHSSRTPTPRSLPTEPASEAEDG